MRSDLITGNTMVFNRSLTQGETVVAAKAKCWFSVTFVHQLLHDSPKGIKDVPPRMLSLLYPSTSLSVEEERHQQADLTDLTFDSRKSPFCLIQDLFDARC